LNIQVAIAIGEEVGTIVVNPAPVSAFACDLWKEDGVTNVSTIIMESTVEWDVHVSKISEN